MPTAALLPTGSLPFRLAGVTNVTQVAQLTGPDSLNKTDRFVVAGQDLGSMFETDGKTWFVFGDTFGQRDEGMTGGGGDRVAIQHDGLDSTDTDPSDGITFDGYIVDETGWAKELLPAKKVDNVEMTVIPTYGFAANGAMYLDYMSVRHWGEPGEWETNYSGSGQVDRRRADLDQARRARAGRATATSSRSASRTSTAICTSGASPTAGSAECS